MKKFKCNCDFHIIECDKRPINGLNYIGLTIYEFRSGNTGKLFKKLKELGTVILIGKEAIKFKKYINGK
jgi:5-deoxy-D-glucuronate isomerase